MTGGVNATVAGRVTGPDLVAVGGPAQAGVGERVVAAVPTAAKVPPLAPGARQMSYPVTPELSVEAVQDSVAGRR